MSRGPGKWQRLILRGLEKFPAFNLRDLLPEDATAAQISALCRACRQLENAGRINVIKWWSPGGRILNCGGRYWLTVTRLGVTSKHVDRAALGRLSVALREIFPEAEHLT